MINNIKNNLISKGYSFPIKILDEQDARNFYEQYKVDLQNITSEEKQEEAIRSYKKGDDVTSIILSIDSDRERVSLGIKQLSEDKPKVLDNEETESE